MNPIKIKKIGIAISTYTEEATHPKRYNIIEKSLQSLIHSIKDKPSDIEIFIIAVIDGEVPKQHLELLDKFSGDITLIHKARNGGIAKAKNTGIKAILSKGANLGILVDDDVLYHQNWIETYTKYIEDFQIHHHAWNDKRIFEHLKIDRPNIGALKSFSYINKKGYDLFTHPGSCGIFLTFTPLLIKKIGYFKVMPGKYGSEHQHFTLRANKAGLIGHPQELVNSYEYIEHIGVFDHNASVGEQQTQMLRSVSDDFLANEPKNTGLNNKDIDGYFPCIE